MDHKAFDLLEKVYIELQDTKKEVKKDISEVKKDVKQLNNRVIKTEILIENSIALQINSLFEAQMITNEKLGRVEEKLEEISQKVNKHDIKIQVIEGGN
ncbi:hypothetical protein [Candidatus Contubernalis alkaliaceticus]|uniref:hypothetical protein n=1 Tax=Candidatus Contubernalis alkaliaceticus TaxID=338645 RepID=UPI001F4BE976|nr:hypothetical protein [Candidatus Contubernalis alkalaceticus]UNC91949.1 hypothetical protein HUE98_07465 [Candidatus Contubernalis alkalaceticus]